MSRIKDLPINFFKCGVTGWCLEVIFTSVESILAHDWRLIGRTSLLMFPIYGMGALLAPISTMVDRWIGELQIRPSDRIVRHGMLDMVLIFTTEYLAGMWLRARGMCPWDYSGRPTNVNGLIRLDFAPCWFLAGLLFEQIAASRPLLPPSPRRK